MSPDLTSRIRAQAANLDATRRAHDPDCYRAGCLCEPRRGALVRVVDAVLELCEGDYERSDIQAAVARAVGIPPAPPPNPMLAVTVDDLDPDGVPTEHDPTWRHFQDPANRKRALDGMTDQEAGDVLDIAALRNAPEHQGGA